jgi:ribosomal protein L11 methyltransferase
VNPICYELKILVNNHQKDPLVDLLLDLDITEFVEGSVDCDIEFDYNTEHYKHDYYADIDSLSPLVIYSEDLSYLELCKSRILEHTNFQKLGLNKKTIQVVPLADQNWRESWKASFKPILIDGIQNGFAIVPPWEAQNEFPQKHKIVIDPGMAFGTGQHETTHLCMQLLIKLSDANSAFKSVLDVGTGSGILAIAAHKLGATNIVGNDIDSPSVQIATNNAADNGTTSIFFTDKDISLLGNEPVDLLFANIQFKPLVRILPALRMRLADHSRIIFSGILASEELDFAMELKKAGIDPIEVLHRGDWIGILAKSKLQK